MDKINSKHKKNETDKIKYLSIFLIVLKNASSILIFLPIKYTIEIMYKFFAQINLEKKSASPKGMKAQIVTRKVKNKINLSTSENLNNLTNKLMFFPKRNIINAYINIMSFDNFIIIITISLLNILNA